MALVYFDSSALVKLLVEEPGSDVAAALWDGCDAAFSSRLANPEVSAALAAAHRKHQLDDAQLGVARRTWSRFWGSMRPVELTESVAILFDRYPDLALAGEPESRGTFVLRGFRRVPVTAQGG